MFWILPFLLEDIVTSPTLQDAMSVWIKVNTQLSTFFSWIEIGLYRQKYAQENVLKDKKKNWTLFIWIKEHKPASKSSEMKRNKPLVFDHLHSVLMIGNPDWFVCRTHPLHSGFKRFILWLSMLSDFIISQFNFFIHVKEKSISLGKRNANIKEFFIPFD